LLDDRGDQSERQRLAASDAQFYEVSDLSDTLAQLVEHGSAAAQQSTAVDSRFDAGCVAIEQANAESLLERRYPL
jgi:hypothetical protein